MWEGLPEVGFTLSGRISARDAIGMGGTFDADAANAVNRRDGYAAEEHTVGRLVVYPGMPPAFRLGKAHVTDRIFPGGETGNWGLHRLVTTCGIEDRAYRFYALQEDITGREPVDWDALEEAGLLCGHCFRYRKERQS